MLIYRDFTGPRYPCRGSMLGLGLDLGVALLVEQFTDFGCGPVGCDLAMIHQDDPGAHALDLPDVVADKKNGSSLSFDHFLHPVEALALKRQVAHRQHFIHDEDFCLDAGGYGKCELDLHARAVALDRGVDEFRHLGKVDDLVELLVDLLPRHAEDGAIEVDVFPPGEVGHEARADFDERCDAAVDLDAPRVGVLILASIFSRVDLPAPLWPMMPTTSPCSMEKLTSSSALNSGRSVTFLPVRRAPVLSRVCLRPCMAPRRYSLVRWLTSMMGIGFNLVIVVWKADSHPSSCFTNGDF